MSDRRASEKPDALRRRDALKGLGALLVTPTLAAAGCGSSAVEGMSGGSTGEAGAAAGGMPAATSGSAGRAAAGPSTSAAQTTAAQKPAATAGSAGSASATPARAASSGGAPAQGNAGQTAAASGGTSTAGAAGGAPPLTASAGTSASSPATDFIPVIFDEATSCTLTPTDPAGEGPFFIHEDEVMNDVSLLRTDMRDGRPGVELQLNLRLLDSEGMCMKPIAGVEVYTWHTDASGLYSGFANQNPDQSYMGAGERTVENMDRFCRGIQISDEQGSVRFKTVYPGWYNGRAIHIHFLALRPGSGPGTMSYRGKQYMVFTTQLYFAEAFSRMIHENHEPYKKRASGMSYNSYVKPQNMTVNPSMRMEGAIAVGTLNIITGAMGSRR